MYKGKLISADFEERTMEFEIEHEFKVKSGKYVILTKKEYEDLVNTSPIDNVVVPKGTMCDVCGSKNTITVSHKGENCDWCNPL